MGAESAQGAALFRCSNLKILGTVKTDKMSLHHGVTEKLVAASGPLRTDTRTLLLSFLSDRSLCWQVVHDDTHVVLHNIG